MYFLESHDHSFIIILKKLKTEHNSLKDIFEKPK